MNKSDVLKALEQCVNGVDSCGGCPLIGCFECREVLLVHALDTINSQKAEIELLKLENKKLHETNNALNYQVDVWKPNEVLNKFLERLSIYVIPQKREGYNSDIVLKSTIDSLVKELTEKLKEEHNGTAQT